MAKGKLGRRTIYAMTIVTILAVSGGYAAAAVFSQTTVYQHSEGYNVINQGTTDWPTDPTVNYVTIPSSVACGASGTTAGSATPATFYVLQNTTTGNGGCAAGDFGEQFTFTSLAGISTQGTDTFQFSASWMGTYGMPPTSCSTGTCVTTVTFTLTVAPAAPGVSQTAVFDLDFAQYGSINILALSVVVSGS